MYEYDDPQEIFWDFDRLFDWTVEAVGSQWDGMRRVFGGADGDPKGLKDLKRGNERLRQETAELAAEGVKGL